MANPAESDSKAPAPPPAPSSAAAIASAASQRRIAIAVDLSDESAYAVRWAVQNYLRPGDAVVLLHVRPTSVLYGADWGFTDLSLSAAAEGSEEEEAAAAAAASVESQQKKMEDDFDAFTAAKVEELRGAVHIVKDHDMKSASARVERLGVGASSWQQGLRAPGGQQARLAASATTASTTAYPDDVAVSSHDPSEEHKFPALTPSLLV
ncbi:hypothetical protein ACMD2_24449 [Ananas comosus]|uniref:UspA domain-containing protein n=1 Tax=Ananas comosus TaxID=4615 RepID=A0A199VY71_ANACO|nr:hypothetical protein ACMD2_24449 [Ananas comosus]